MYDYNTNTVQECKSDALEGLDEVDGNRSEAPESLLFGFCICSGRKPSDKRNLNAL